MIGTHVGYADIRAVADAFVHEMGATYTIRPTEHPSFIRGRVAAMLDAQGQPLGRLGEVHPVVLENYGLKHAVSVLEMSLAQLLGT
jgi:phenylalanyl-tRNA synthetase beta chain